MLVIDMKIINDAVQLLKAFHLMLHIEFTMSSIEQIFCHYCIQKIDFSHRIGSRVQFEIKLRVLSFSIENPKRYKMNVLKTQQ